MGLKRSTGELSLYGARHVTLRQAFFNELTQERRINLCRSKLKAANIFDWILDTLKCKESNLLDVIDVGKGRSIYKIVVSKDRTYVIIEKTNNNQRVFNNVAQKFQMPSPKSYFKKVGDKYWELTEFLDEHEIFYSKKDALVNIYAKAAAFGDFIELGDRHFENYISRNENLIAIDVAHLMEKDNEHWTKKYIAGGLYEVCILQYYMNDYANLNATVEVFFESYQQHANALFKVRNALDEDAELFRKINEQWVDKDQFVQHMHGIYIPALNEMFNRMCYKSLLQQLVENNIDLDAHQELKMFYLADENRISTFFRSEELTVDVFMVIRELALKHLGVTQQYFNDHNESLKRMKDCLDKQLLKRSMAIK